MKVFIVIAAYNEEKKIGQVLGSLAKQGYKNIVVVDDGSVDNTFAAAEKKGVVVLRHIVNRGQGAALQTGIKYALAEGADILVTYDADGQFIPQEIERMVKPVKNNEVDITIGSRFLGKAVNIPFLKKLVLKLGVIVVYLLYGVKVTDSQCGFRAISRSAAENIYITSDRMEHAGEILSEIGRNRLRYREVPVTVIYDEYALKKGQGWTNSIDLGLKMIYKRFLR